MDENAKLSNRIDNSSINVTAGNEIQSRMLINENLETINLTSNETDCSGNLTTDSNETITESRKIDGSFPPEEDCESDEEEKINSNETVLNSTEDDNLTDIDIKEVILFFPKSNIRCNLNQLIKRAYFLDDFYYFIDIMNQFIQAITKKII